MPRLSERPLRRSLVKLGCELLLGRRRRHMHAWWPGLALHGDAAGARRIVWRGHAVGMLAGLGPLRGRAAPELVVVGSGPSVQQVAVERLAAHSTILLNGAVSLMGVGLAEPLAVAVEDERFIWRRFALLRERVAPTVPLLLSVSVLRAVCEIDPGFLAGRTLLLIDDLRKPYGADRREPDALARLPFVVLDAASGAGFSRDPERGVFLGGSVAVSALQFALACAPRSVGLVGIDIVNADQPRFYERAGDVAASGVARAASRIVDHLVLARRVAATDGVPVLNHSPVSALVAAGFGYDARHAAQGG